MLGDSDPTFTPYSTFTRLIDLGPGVSCTALSDMRYRCTCSVGFGAYPNDILMPYWSSE